jgi:Cof subfamily protein (haloacid dehalogenase superfamily)
MDYKMVFFDIDGTLVNEAKEIPVSTKKAVQALKEKEINVMIATGRSPYHAKIVADELGIDSMINFNGSYITHKGTIIYKQALLKQEIKKLYQFVSQHNLCLTYLGENDYATSDKENPYYLQMFGNRTHWEATMDPFFFEKNEVFQIFLHSPKEMDELFKQTFPHFDFIRWAEFGMDVIPKNHSKALGIQKITKLLSIPPSEMVAFGDGENDKEMIEYVGMGIAMGNADKKLKPLANFVTSHVDEDGILNGLKNINLL